MRVASSAILVLTDPRPEASEDVAEELRKDVRLLNSGELCDQWTILAEIMEGTIPWKGFLVGYKRSAWSDLTIGPETRKAIDTLGTCGFADVAIIVGKLEGWLSQAREQGLRSLEDKLVERLSQWTAQLGRKKNQSLRTRTPPPPSPVAWTWTWI